MREVISNTSPLQYLFQAELLDLLPALYGTIVVPSGVADELAEERTLGVALPDPQLFRGRVSTGSPTPHCYGSQPTSIRVSVRFSRSRSRPRIRSRSWTTPSHVAMRGCWDPVHRNAGSPPQGEVSRPPRAGIARARSA